jgi:hypothetical protein
MAEFVAVLVAVAACLTAVMALGKPASAEVVSGYYDRQVTVPGNTANDIDTGITLRAGDRVTVGASGEIWPCPSIIFCPGVGPVGGDRGANSDWPLPGQREYSLIGKTGGQYFYVGNGRSWIHQGGSDKLYLYVNDIWTSDNGGRFVANIRVDRDVPLPETSINSGPSGEVTANSAAFGFSGSSPDGGVRYECSLDGAGFAPCFSPESYSALGIGPHEFRVRAVDRFNRPDPTPASRNWTVVENTPPEIGPVKPTGKIRDRTPLIEATVKDAQTDLTQSHITLKVDGAVKTFAYDAAGDKLVRQSNKLAFGKHKVSVEATDGQETTTRIWSFKVAR